MTKTLGIDANNDIYLGPDGNLVLLAGQDAVMGGCATASKAQLGEMVLAVNAGMPNFQAIWVGVPNYAIWKQALLQTLQGVPGVVQVTDVRMFSQNNVLSYTATIASQFGQSEVQAALQ